MYIALGQGQTTPWGQFFFINIAKSELSSHTPGGSHHRRLRPYHVNFLERKNNSTNNETDKQYEADSLIHSRNCHK